VTVSSDRSGSGQQPIDSLVSLIQIASGIGRLIATSLNERSVTGARADH